MVSAEAPITSSYVGGDCRKSRESIGELSVAGLIVESGGAKGNEFTQIPF
jgi:hypothetical protein